MSEQPPPSARALIKPWIRPLGLDAIQVATLTDEIESLCERACEQRVSARKPAAPSVASLEQEIRRLRDCIVSARWRLTKGRALWNGPCHECDAALERALTGRESPSDTRRAAIEECAGHLKVVRKDRVPFVIDPEDAADPQPETTLAAPPSPAAVVDYTERARKVIGGVPGFFDFLIPRVAAALSAVASEHQAAPIPMVLFCPACGAQHIDKANWDSPPHRTHQCQGCGHLWRPASVYTEGVADIPLGTSDVRPAIRGQGCDAMAALRGSVAALRRARAGLSVAIRAAVEDIDFDPGEHHAIKDIDAALAALDAASAAGDAGL